MLREHVEQIMQGVELLEYRRDDIASELKLFHRQLHTISRVLRVGWGFKTKKGAVGPL